MRHREFTEIKKIIGKNIQLLRKQHQLTQEQISDRLNLSTSAYCKIEYGETDLTIPRLFLLAGIYCMSPVALLATICEGVTLVVPDGRQEGPERAWAPVQGEERCMYDLLLQQICSNTQVIGLLHDLLDRLEKAAEMKRSPTRD